MEQDCGRFYVIDTVANVIAFKDVDLEFLGRDLPGLVMHAGSIVSQDGHATGEVVHETA